MCNPAGPGMNAIQKAIDQVGGAARLATALRTSPQRINNWLVRGIPNREALNIAAATGWRVTPHELRPDIYPHPDDGLPVELRSTQREHAA